MAEVDGGPTWPSLYNLGIEIDQLQGHNPTQPGGHYLYHANDIFRFTLYWTLAFYTPAFILCGIYAFFNLAFPPARGASYSAYAYSSYPMLPLVPTQSASGSKPPRTNARRSRVTFAILVLLTYLVVGLAGAVLGAAIGGYVLAGLFRAGHFNMSTWVPFIWVLIQVFVGFLGLWPSVVEII
ncbi:hypothetical protein PLICRDRAFT_42820 [Plicaturopsis crispa FD-325 SS-3]|nr:hypothetical protein PLICRDRAFT_42820 [Plicaturopsis crispa FD-325 SS-3]